MSTQNSVTDVVPSPCVKVCVVNADHCEGCGRSLVEIGQWRHMSNQEKQIILDRVDKENAVKREFTLNTNT